VNREILFRAKSSQSWCYGYVHKDYESPMPNKWRLTTAYGDVKVINSDTIGEWTGLLDKNNVMIFEGDIVSKEFYTNHKRTKSKSFKGVVEYKVRCGKGFGIDGEDFKSWAAEWSVNFNFGSDEQKYRAYSWGLFFDCEVIGNIYDNPELIEK
jgi:uncharacterized phage protein (TIGR01671 family)